MVPSEEELIGFFSCKRFWKKKKATKTPIRGKIPGQLSLEIQAPAPRSCSPAVILTPSTLLQAFGKLYKLLMNTAVWEVEQQKCMSS